MSSTNPWVVDPRASFLADVCRNLTAVGRSQGQHSALYGDLVSRYREVAATLGCEAELEQVMLSILTTASQRQRRRLSSSA